MFNCYVKVALYDVSVLSIFIVLPVCKFIIALLIFRIKLIVPSCLVYVFKARTLWEVAL